MALGIDILGSYFPGWLLSAILGIILAGCGRIVLAKANLHAALVLPMVFYASLAFLWAAAFWLLFFF